MKKLILSFLTTAFACSMTFAQFRAGDQSGINVFEQPKSDVEFKFLKTEIGGSFTQAFQRLDHNNTATPLIVSGVDQNKLVELSPGFNLASANLAFKTLLSDGVALNMELYLASRHHNETWVKGGYLQLDKIPFINLGLVDNVMKYTTIKIGQFDVNYGDAHFRRSDGGNSLYNPFVDNYIMDEFATEVGAEVDVNYNGFIAVASITNGLLKGDVTEVSPVAGGTDGHRRPSVIGKLGYDKKLTDDFRLRVTGSVYYNESAVSNTLFGGDRTGSHYFGVLHYQAPGTGNAFNGRINPGMTDYVRAYMGNLFIKFHGLESFTTLETVSGRAKAEWTGSRTANQFATDLVYRFGKNENFFVGARYNKVDATMAPVLNNTTHTITTPAYDISSERVAFAAGWFITKNVETKAEYVTQYYDGYATNNILNGARFEGLVVEAIIGF